MIWLADCAPGFVAITNCILPDLSSGIHDALAVAAGSNTNIGTFFLALKIESDSGCSGMPTNEITASASPVCRNASSNDSDAARGDRLLKLAPETLSSFNLICGHGARILPKVLKRESSASTFDFFAGGNKR